MRDRDEITRERIKVVIVSWANVHIGSINQVESEAEISSMIDSMDSIELIIVIEDSFEIKFNEQDLIQCITFDHLYDLIYKKSNHTISASDI